MAKHVITVAVAGAGYFASYHLDAWSRLDGVRLCAVADPDTARCRAASDRHGLQAYADVEEMLERERPDVIDIVTPPATHHAIAVLAATRGIHVICQKPLAPTTAEAASLIDAMAGTGVRFMVHENWRWQPWYRTIRKLFDEGIAGAPYSASFTMRTGDGWTADAYLERQPYFRDYPRLLLFETGVHLVDTFRYLFGDVRSVYAQIRPHNPVIEGEDAAVCVLTFESEAADYLRTVEVVDACYASAESGSVVSPAPFGGDVISER